MGWFHGHLPQIGWMGWGGCAHWLSIHPRKLVASARLVCPRLARPHHGSVCSIGIAMCWSTTPAAARVAARQAQGCPSYSCGSSGARKSLTAAKTLTEFLEAALEEFRAFTTAYRTAGCRIGRNRITPQASCTCTVPEGRKGDCARTPRACKLMTSKLPSNCSPLRPIRGLGSIPHCVRQ